MRKMADGSHWLAAGEDLREGHRNYQVPSSFIKSDIMDDGTEIYSRGKSGRMIQPCSHPVWGDGFIVDKVKYGEDGWVRTKPND